MIIHIWNPEMYEADPSNLKTPIFHSPFRNPYRLNELRDLLSRHVFILKISDFLNGGRVNWMEFT
jgi:hypothetical protein